MGAPRTPPTTTSGIASSESVRNFTERRIEKDTAVRAVSPPSVYLSRSFSRTSLDASEEVSLSPRQIRLQRGLGEQYGKAKTMSKEEMLEVKVCSDDSRIQSREECPEGCLPSDEALAPIVETDKDLKLNTSIYHYMSVEHFLDMIENKRNVLMHVSYWEDPFEAFLFRGGITAANEDGDDAGELYDAFKFLYGQSWTLTENESDIVWRAMGKRGTVVRIKTTIRKLAASILSQPGLSSGGWSRIKKIKYLKPKEFNRFLTRNMVDSIMKGDNDAREKCLFQKREAFSLENEVRVVVIPNENALDRERCVHGCKDFFLQGHADFVQITCLRLRSRQLKNSSRRPDFSSVRSGIIPLAPLSDQNIPDCLSRAPRTVLQPLSTTPEPMNRPSASNLS